MSRPGPRGNSQAVGKLEALAPVDVRNAALGQAGRGPLGIRPGDSTAAFLAPAFAEVETATGVCVQGTENLGAARMKNAFRFLGVLCGDDRVFGCIRLAH